MDDNTVVIGLETDHGRESNFDLIFKFFFQPPYFPNDNNNSEIVNLIERIDRNYQDLSQVHESSDLRDERTIDVFIKINRIINGWLPVIKFSVNADIRGSFISDLEALNNLILQEIAALKSHSALGVDWNDKFSIPFSSLLALQEACKTEFHKISEVLLDIDKANRKVVHDLHIYSGAFIIELTKSKENTYRENIYKRKPRQLEGVSDLDLIYEQVSKSLSLDTVLTCTMTLYIDTCDAIIANNYMHIVTAVLGSIRDVEIEIIDAGKGSYWQKCKLKITGFFARDEVKDVLKKSKESMEAQLYGKHVVPVEKMVVEKNVLEQELNSMMPTENAQELHQIRLEKEKSELEQIKLQNLKTKLELIKEMSEMLSLGLLKVDSDFSIELSSVLGDTMTIFEKKGDNYKFIDELNDIDNVLSTEE